MNQITDSSQRYFSTYDLGLSSALVATGFTLDHLEKADPRKVMFMFQRTAGLDIAIQSYWANELPVNAQTYFNAVKMIKNQIYSQ